MGTIQRLTPRRAIGARLIRILVAVVFVAAAAVLPGGEGNAFRDGPSRDPVSGTAAAREALEGAVTYHRLARQKGNDIYALGRARDYAEEALAALEGLRSQEAARLRSQARAALDEFAVRYENNFDTIGNEVPLFGLLTGRNRVNEYVDDPDVIAVTRAAEAAISALPPLREGLQFDAVVVSDPKNPALEDEVWSLLSRSPRFYPRSSEEVLKILSEGERKELYEADAGEAMRKLSEGWGSTHLLHVALTERAVLEDLYYFTVDFRSWTSPSASFTASLRTDGFALDRRGAPGRVLILFALVLALAVAAPVAHRCLLLFRDPHDQGRVHFWAGPLSTVVGFGSALTVAAALAPLAPPSDALVVLARSRMWIFIFPLAALVLGLVLSYLLLARIPASRERLSNAEALASIISGAGLGVGALVVSAHLVRFGATMTVGVGLAAGVTALVAGAWAGEGLFQVLTRGRRIGAVPAVLSLAALVVLTVGVMMSAPGLAVGAAVAVSAGFTLSTAARAAWKHPLLRRRPRVGSHGPTRTTGERLTLEGLRSLAGSPAKYVDPSETGDFLEGKVDAVLSHVGEGGHTGRRRGAPYTVLLVGTGASGKTRTALELGRRVLGKYAENSGGRRGVLLFGDCDEMNADGSGVPYEPFAQALYELLGAGRFEPPSKRASKVSAGLKRVGLETALGAVGLGVLGSLMGTETTADDGTGETVNASATAAEMAHTVSRTLVELTRKHDGPVVFILDDLHWIDSVTCELFERVLYELAGAAESSRVVLILTVDPDRLPQSAVEEEGERSRGDAGTARAGSDGAVTAEADPGTRAFTLVERLGAGRALVLDRISQTELSNPSRFDNLLVDALRFERDSAALLLRKLADYAPDTVGSVLRSVVHLIDLGAVEVTSVEQRVRLRRDFDFSRLPPPDELGSSVRRVMADLSQEQNNLIECAAFVGYEFNAEVLADVLSLDRLYVLQQLRILEERDIVYDVIDQDDVYAFRSRAFAAALRHYVSMADAESLREVPQVVREYHHRVARSITKRMERWGDTVETIPINELIALARRSFAAGDRMIEEAFTFNRAAALRTRARGRYRESAQFAGQAVELAEKLRALDHSSELFEMRMVSIEMGTVIGYPREYVEGRIESAAAALTTAADDAERAEREAELLIRRADLLLRPRDVETVTAETWGSMLEKAEAAVGEEQLGDLLRLNLELMRLRVRWVLDSRGDYMAELEQLLSHCEELLEGDGDTAGLLRLQSETLEDIATAHYTSGTYEQAVEALGRAIAVKGRAEVNDQEGIAKLQTYLGASLREQGRLDEAVGHYREALDCADRCGSAEHVVTASVSLGALLRRQDPDEAFAVLSRGLREAAATEDVRGQYNSLTEILRVAADTGDSLLAEEFLDEADDLLGSHSEGHDDARAGLLEALRDVASVSAAARRLLAAQVAAGERNGV